jgi:hypothetical protein
MSIIEGAGKHYGSAAESAELRCLRAHHGRPRAYIEGDPWVSFTGLLLKPRME